jgi:Sulfotransferase family
MAFPNFFIVGAPKCGTTALYAYLRSHPDVFMPDVKEPHYFGSDLAFRYRRRPDEQRYRSYFAGADGRSRVGEASIWYLYSTAAAAEIREAVPQARAVAMVRDPVEMITAMHSQFVYNGHEDLPLAEALDAEPERAAGRRIPESANFPAGLLYRRVASFADQIERYYDILGRDKVHVVVFDDLKADPARTYRCVLEFLGVDPEHRPDFEVVNANKVARSTTFRRLLNDPPEWLRTPVRAALPWGLRRRVYRALVSANIKREPRAEVDPGVLDRLRDEMAGSVRRLEALLGRELGAWLPKHGQ